MRCPHQYITWDSLLRTELLAAADRQGKARQEASSIRRVAYNTYTYRQPTPTMTLGRIRYLLLVLLALGSGAELNNDDDDSEPQLAKLVKLFSKPGAFNQINEIFGEELTSKTSHSLCPDGEDGLECRRAEARRSVDCPRGDCYCYNCSRTGPELWASCCRERLKCCSHLAAACRTCDQPPLYPFCAKHFKKCLSQLNDKKSLQA